MFRAKTVFVLGAGANAELGMPLGDTLLKRIAKTVNVSGDPAAQNLETTRDFIWSIQALADQRGEKGDISRYWTAGDQVARSAELAMSIDNLIEALEDDYAEIVGKAGIATVILNGERSSKLSRNHRAGYDVDHSQIVDSWFPSLVKILTENVKKSQVADVFTDVEFITFNYDRCLEHYLPSALSRYYGLHVAEMQKLVADVPVHRAYGQCGKLPWMKGDLPVVGFGECKARNISAVAGQLKTFTEQREEGDEILAMRRAIREADRVVFLGFAYHRQNLELLATRVDSDTVFLGTAMGISHSDQAVIVDDIAREFEFGDPVNASQRVTLTNKTCADFFKEYWRTITAKAQPKIAYTLEFIG